MIKKKKQFSYTSLLVLAFSLLCSINVRAQDAVKFLSLNIWNEGIQVPNGWEKTRDVVLETNPDIVCFSEVRNYFFQDWTTTIVNMLSDSGQTYYGSFIGGDVSLISKFPITNSTLITYGEGSIAMFEIELPSQTIYVGCAHLDYTNYATYLPRGYNGGIPNWSMIDNGNGNPDPVLDINQIITYNLESTRDEQISAFLNATDTISAPIVFMGDFNEPSHLDWIDSTGNMFDHNQLTLPWSNTITLENNGFVDSYRDFYPNPVTHPGITWPSFADQMGSTSWTPLSDERDRIDYIFYKGSNILNVYSALVGTKKSYAYNQITTSHTSNETFLADNLLWPSDHKGVFSTLYFGTPLDISENITENDFKIYPNPVNQILTVEGVTIENDNFNVFNMLGLDVSHSVHVNGNKIDFSNLSKGLYIVKVNDFVKKVYKQ